jgi:hypothetical protein
MINRYDIEKNRNKSTQEQKKTIKTPTTPSMETATKIATTMVIAQIPK